MRFDPALAGYEPARAQQFYRTLMERVPAMPGVQSAALASSVPFENTRSAALVIPEGYQFAGAQSAASVINVTIDEHYFQTLGIPILQGRGFLESDGPNSPRVIVINQEFARVYFDGNAVGKRVRIGENEPWSEVIGVVPSGKYVAVIEPPTPRFYIPYRQIPMTRMTLIVESRGDAAAMAAPLKQITESIDAQVPMLNVRTLEDIWEQRSVKIFTLISNVVNSIGAIGLGLALIGLYAVVSYQVSRRTREIGVRMAVGADARSVLAMILRQSAAMGVVGVVIGMVVSFAGSKVLSAGPLSAPPMDTGLFAMVPLVLLLTTIAAAAVPARRAARIDPLRALRQE
jgi:predicted permease